MTNLPSNQFDVYRNKKVLVTGHTGFKGAWLCQWLLELGADVTGYSKDVPTTPSLFDKLSLKTKLQHVVGDIRDREAFARTAREVQPDFVFHLAAQSLVRASYREPVETMATNVLGTVHVLDAFRSWDRPLCVVNVTSDKCYENRNWHFGYRETDALGGSDPYSASKGAAEIVFSSYFRSFFAGSPVRAASARAGNVIGGGDYAEDRLVPDCIRAWSAGEKVVLRNPEAIRPWQHVLEPLSGYLRLGSALSDASEEANTNGEAFNFGPHSDAFQPVARVVKTLSTYFSGAETTLMAPQEREQQPHEATILKLCTDKAENVLGWRPTLRFEEALEWTGRWYRSESSKDVHALTLDQIRKFAALRTRQTGLRRILQPVIPKV